MRTRCPLLMIGALLLCSLLFHSPSFGQSVPPESRERTLVVVDGRMVGTMVLDTAQRRRLEQVEIRIARDRAGLMDVGAALDPVVQEKRLRQLDEQRLVEIREVLTKEQYAEWLRLVGQTPTTSEQQ